MAETQVPIAAGKAAALSTYLARGGELVTKKGKRKPGPRYSSGPMRGKTVEQATQEFERLWGSANGAVKDKYARRETQEAALAPSEQKALGSNFRPNAPVQDMSQAATQKRRMASYGYELDEKGAAVKIEPKSNAGRGKLINKAFDEKRDRPASDEYAPGSDEARAAALTENSRNERYATADNGSTSDAAAAAMANEVNPSLEKAFPGLQAKASGVEPAKIGESIPAPITGAMSDSNAAYKTMADQRKATNYPAATAAIPFTNNDVAKERANPTPQQMVSPEAPTGAPILDRPPMGEVKDSSGKVIRKIEMDPAIKSDGAGLTRVNRLTGLPFNFRPGDALPSSANSAMQQRSSNSQARQIANQANARPVAQTATSPQSTGFAVPRGPASQPAKTGSSIAPIAPPRANDPDILRKDDELAAKYQANFGNESSDQEFDDSKNAQKKLYDNASSLDQAKLVGNTMRRAGKMNQTFNSSVATAPRALIPGQFRVASQRPASAEEDRLRKPVAPITRR